MKVVSCRICEKTITISNASCVLKDQNITWQEISAKIIYETGKRFNVYAFVKLGLRQLNIPPPLMGGVRGGCGVFLSPPPSLPHQGGGTIV